MTFISINFNQQVWYFRRPGIVWPFAVLMNSSISPIPDLAEWAPKIWHNQIRYGFPVLGAQINFTSDFPSANLKLIITSCNATMFYNLFTLITFNLYQIQFPVFNMQSPPSIFTPGGKNSDKVVSPIKTILYQAPFYHAIYAFHAGTMNLSKIFDFQLFISLFTVC